MFENRTRICNIQYKVVLIPFVVLLQLFKSLSHVFGEKKIYVKCISRLKVGFPDKNCR